MDVQNTDTPDSTVLTLEKFKPFDATLIETAADYANLVIVGTDDKKGYKAVTDAISRLTKLRTGIEQTRVDIKAPALAFGKRVDLEAKRLTDLISGAENKLRKERQRIDTIVEQNRQEAERVEMETFTRRANALFEAGFVFDGTDYVAGDLKILAEGLTSLTDVKFDECLRMGAEQVQIEKAAKLAFKLAQDERERQAEQAAVETAIVTQGGQPADDATQLGDLFPDSVDAYLSGDAPPVDRTAPRPVKIGEGNIQRSLNLIEREFDQLADEIIAPGSFVDQFNAAQKAESESFSAGFEKCRSLVLEILNRPDKFTRDQLRGIIQGLK